MNQYFNIIISNIHLLMFQYMISHKKDTQRQFLFIFYKPIHAMILSYHELEKKKISRCKKRIIKTGAGAWPAWDVSSVSMDASVRVSYRTPVGSSACPTHPSRLFQLLCGQPLLVLGISTNIQCYLALFIYFCETEVTKNYIVRTAG